MKLLVKHQLHSAGSRKNTRVTSIEPLENAALATTSLHYLYAYYERRAVASLGNCRRDSCTQFRQARFMEFIRPHL